MVLCPGHLFLEAPAPERSPHAPSLPPPPRGLRLTPAAHTCFPSWPTPTLGLAVGQAPPVEASDFSEHIQPGTALEYSGDPNRLREICGLWVAWTSEPRRTERLGLLRRRRGDKRPCLRD